VGGWTLGAFVALVLVRLSQGTSAVRLH